MNMDTLLKVGIGAAAIIVGVVAFLRCSADLGGGNQEEATRNAEAWAVNIGIPDAHVNCVQRDTDGDGYISCTVSYKNKNGEVKTQAIECTGKYTINTGCRTPKFNIREQ